MPHLPADRHFPMLTGDVTPKAITAPERRIINYLLENTAPPVSLSIAILRRRAQGDLWKKAARNTFLSVKLHLNRQTDNVANGIFIYHNFMNVFTPIVHSVRLLFVIV